MNSPAQTPGLAANILASGTINLARGMIGFGAGVIVARILGPAGRGELTLVTSTVLIFVTLASMGMGSALTQARAKGDRSIADLYSASVVVGIVVGIVAIAAGFMIYELAGKSVLKVSNDTDLLWVPLLTVPLLILNNWTVVAYLEDHIRELGTATIAGALVFFSGAVAARLLGGLTPSKAIALWAVSSLVPLLLLVRPRRLRIVADLPQIANALVRFSLKANLAILALILVLRIDVLLVDWKRGLRELGLYAVAVALGEVLLQVGISARIGLTPLQGSASQRDILVTRICRLNRLMLAALVTAAAVLMLASGLVVRLAYGPGFAEAAPALAWILPGVVALVLQGPPLDYLIIEGRVREVIVVTVLALVVNVAINLIFLPGHSFVVAAIASTAAYVISCVLILVLFARQTGVGLRPLVVIEGRDISAIRFMWRGRPAGAS